MASTALSMVPYPVSTTAAGALSCSCIARRSCMPSMTGILRSVRTTSKLVSARRARAASPCVACSTSCPARSRFLASVRAMFVSSSTRRMCARISIGLDVALARQLDREGGAGADLARHLDLALVAPQDRVHDGEAEAGALAGRLRRLEGVEDVLQVLARDPDTGVADVEPDAVLADQRRAQHELAALGHRLHGVGEEVQDDLPHGVHVGQAGGDQSELGGDPHAVVLQVLLHELQGAREEVVDVQALELRARLAGELEQVLDDRLRALDLLLRDAQILDRLRVLTVEDLAQVVERVHDDGERIAQLVRDARGE